MRRAPAATTRATALVAVSACCFGLIPILTVVATRAGTPLPSVLAWRYTLAAALLIAIAPPAALARAPRAAAGRLVVLGGGGQALLGFVSLSSLAFIPAATLAFLFYTYPAWVALLAVVRGTERVGRGRALALVLSLAGLAFVVGGPGTAALDPRGTALALAGAILYAVYIPLVNRLQIGVSPVVASAWVAVGGALCFVVGGATTGSLTLRLAPPAWGAVVALAALSTTLAFVVFLRGLAVLGPVRTAIVSTLEPFATALAAVAVLAQPLPPATLLGGALIAAAVILLQRRPPAVMDAVTAAGSTEATAGSTDDA